MEKEPFDFLKNLIGAIGPSGFEEDAARVWKERTGKFANEVTSDVLGNSIAALNKSGSPKIMFAAHIDEIGFMVKYISKEGFIYFSTIGGVDPHIIPGKRVWIKTKKGKVLGVIGRKPIHLLESEERKAVAKVDEMWVDIGARDEKEAKSILDIGDPFVFSAGLEVLNDDIAVGRGFDDKAGVFAVSEALRIISHSELKASVYGVATVQEEIGLRGAKTSAYGVSPDVGIAIDVTFASDFPSVDKKKIGDIKLGGGPVIARGPNINPRVFELLIETAKEEKIPYQIEGISRATGTDANVIQITKAGVAAGLVSIPNRYMHTQVELVSFKDLENTSKLLGAFALRFNKEINLLP